MSSFVYYNMTGTAGDVRSVIVEALFMHRNRRSLWKMGTVIARVLLLLVFLAVVPVSMANAAEGVSALATPGAVAVQITPTVDATVTALNKEKLFVDIDQQQHTLGNWFWANGATLLSSLVLAIAGIFTLFRYFRDLRSEQKKQREDRQAEREKRDEERFQAAITGLGDEKEGARISATSLLRTFLSPGYERFYLQIFDLIVANLRLLRTSNTLQGSTTLPSALSQSLITTFQEAFPRVRDLPKTKPDLFSFGPEYLDARLVQLDNGYLRNADFAQMRMPQASLRNADLSGANFSGADLRGADFTGAKLKGTKLNGAKLHDANFSGATLSEIDFSNTPLFRIKLKDAKLREIDLRNIALFEVDLQGASLLEVDFQETVLTDVNFRGAAFHNVNFQKVCLTKVDFTGSQLCEAQLSFTEFSDSKISGHLDGADFQGAQFFEKSNIEQADTLKGTNLLKVKGLTKKQLEVCKAKGAIIDENPTINASPSVQGSTPPSDPSGKGVASTQQDSKA